MKEYRTISKIAGPLVFVEKTEPIAYGELVNIVLADGTTKRGQVLDTSDELVVSPDLRDHCRYRERQRCPVHGRDHQDARGQGYARAYPVRWR